MDSCVRRDSVVRANTRRRRMLILKFWIHISDDEQLARFKARQTDPLKKWKLTDEDWRNREKRPEYEGCH